jgi:hypothetical protein
VAVSYVTFGNSASAASSGATLTTAAFTVAAGDFVFAVTSCAAAQTVSSVNCSGDAMTQVGSDANLNNNSANGTLRVYKLEIGSSGSKTVSATVTGTAWSVLGAIVVRGASTVGTPSVVTGTGTALSQSATVPTGSLALQFFGSGVAIGSLTGGTAVFSASDGFEGMAMRYSTTSATFTGTTSSSPWAGVSIIVSPPASNSGQFFAMF